jgi:hypothetical protein
LRTSDLAALEGRKPSGTAVAGVGAAVAGVGAAVELSPEEVADCFLADDVDKAGAAAEAGAPETAEARAAEANAGALEKGAGAPKLGKRGGSSGSSMSTTTALTAFPGVVRRPGWSAPSMGGGVKTAGGSQGAGGSAASGAKSAGGAETAGSAERAADAESAAGAEGAEGGEEMKLHSATVSASVASPSYGIISVASDASGGACSGGASGDGSQLGQSQSSGGTSMSGTGRQRMCHAALQSDPAHTIGGSGCGRGAMDEVEVVERTVAK